MPSPRMTASQQDLERRKKTKELEMLWRGAKSFGKEADVFLGTFPSGMCRDSPHRHA